MHRRTLSLFRKNKASHESKIAEVPNCETKINSVLKKEIENLRNQLSARDSEIAVKDSQIAQLLKVSTDTPIVYVLKSLFNIIFLMLEARTHRRGQAKAEQSVQK